MSATNCGECLMLEAEVVPIVDGKCPRCEERRAVVAFAKQDASMVAGFRKDHPGLLRDPNAQPEPYTGYVSVWLFDAHGNQVDRADVPAERVGKFVARFAQAQAGEGLGGRIEFHRQGGAP